MWSMCVVKFRQIRRYVVGATRAPHPGDKFLALKPGILRES